MTHGTMHGIRGTSGDLAVRGGDDSGASRADGTGANRAAYGGRGAIGAFIRSAREAASLSQRELADRSGITRETIAAWESCYSRPSRDKLEAVCAAMGADPSPFVGSLAYSNKSAVHADNRSRRIDLAAELRKARRMAGATPASLRAHGITERRLRSIEGAYSWPTETEVAIMRQCYRRPDLLPGYKRDASTFDNQPRETPQRREPLSAEERAAAVSGGAFMRRHRLAAGISITEAARKIGVVSTTIKHWERGLERPWPANLTRCAEVLGFSLEAYQAAANTPSDDDVARAARMASAPTFPVRRGSVWTRGAGRRVVVECDAVEGDRIRYRPLPDGDMLITSWETFTARYTEVGA